MEICIRIGEVEHCYYIPVIFWPWSHRPPPGPGPVNYPTMLHDAVLVASVQQAAREARDEGVRVALERGVDAAVDAMQQRAGAHVQIRNTGQTGE